MEVTYTCYTNSVYIIVTALYIWMDSYCFLSMEQFFQLTWISQQLHKGISVIKAQVNDQNVFQLMYLLAVQLNLRLGRQLTLEERGCVRSFHERQNQTESEMKGLILIRLNNELNIRWPITLKQRKLR